jgi:hypothetical protein
MSGCSSQVLGREIAYAALTPFSRLHNYHIRDNAKSVYSEFKGRGLRDRDGGICFPLSQLLICLTLRLLRGLRPP